jgi:myo-inositol-1(or 4)-monophosphatase
LPVADLGLDLAALSARLAATAREAGGVAMGKFRSTFKSWNKDNYSPVSEVDIAIDLLLRERLSALVPQAAWLSEESADDPARLDARLVWVVDPVDGTRAFINGREDWSISIALVEQGRPAVAALYAPASDTLYLAMHGAGATLNEKPLRLDEAPHRAPPLAAGPQRWLDTLAERLPITAAPKVHSLALRIAQIASGDLDIAFAGGNGHDWDLAAADLIVHEAGGALTSLAGKTPLYNCASPVHPPLVAAAREQHADLLKLVAGNRRAFA